MNLPLPLTADPARWLSPLPLEAALLLIWVSLWAEHWLLIPTRLKPIPAYVCGVATVGAALTWYWLHHPFQLWHFWLAFGAGGIAVALAYAIDTLRATRNALASQRLAHAHTAAAGPTRLRLLRDQDRDHHKDRPDADPPGAA